MTDAAPPPPGAVPPPPPPPPPPPVGGIPPVAPVPPAPLPSEAEWPARAADLVDAVVGGLHDRLVRPLALVARGLVFGLIIATMTLVLVVLGAIGLVRLLDVYAFGGRVWASDALIGALFSAAGLALWWKRRPRETPAQ